MEALETVSVEAAAELRQMIEMPIEEQAADVELVLLQNVLQSAIQAFAGAADIEQAAVILSEVIKSAYVIGRRPLG